MTAQPPHEPGTEAAPATGLAGLEPITREPTAGLISRRIREAIIDGTLTPGTQLTEMRLAEQLGVSRAPIREALQRLIQEGLAESRRRGVFIKEFTDADITDLYFARTSCELAAVERILGRPGGDAWEALEPMLDALAQAARTGDWAETVRADRRFHESLVEAAGSPRLTRMFATLIAETAIGLRALEGEYNDFTQLVDEHREIVEALQAGDHGRAVRAVRAHMDDAVARLTGEAAPAP